MKSLIKTLSITLAACALLGAPISSNAATVGVDPSATWVGYMNVSELPSNGGAYLWGSPWATADLDAGFAGPVLTLSPNMNIARNVPVTDAYWWQGGVYVGNKNMDASMYVEPGTGLLAGENVTFTGLVLANTLVSPYTSVAFIKDFAPDFSSFNVTSVALTPGVFSITLATDPGAGRHVQYGFETIGPNAALVNAFGNVQITAVPEPTILALAGLGAAALLIRRRR